MTFTLWAQSLKTDGIQPECVIKQQTQIVETQTERVVGHEKQFQPLLLSSCLNRVIL